MLPKTDQIIEYELEIKDYKHKDLIKFDDNLNEIGFKDMKEEDIGKHEVTVIIQEKQTK